MPRLVSSSRDVDATMSLRPAARAASLVACPWKDWIQAVCTSVSLPYTAWLRNTWPTASSVCLTSRHGDIYVWQQHHNWSYPPPTVQHLAIKRSLSPLHAPGTLFCTHCDLHRHFLPFEDFWRHTYSIVVLFVVLSVFKLYCTVPLKRLFLVTASL